MKNETVNTMCKLLRYVAVLMSAFILKTFSLNIVAKPELVVHSDATHTGSVSHDDSHTLSSDNSYTDNLPTDDSFFMLPCGKTVTCLSPYDDLIKKYAENINWDWRMLAALIYQESKFIPDIHSDCGAVGLMQIMPSTAKTYGIDNPLNPEENIIAGTKHLKRLEELYRNSGMTDEERIKFVLASYNAGEGHIFDCRNLAEMNNLDNKVWDNMIEVIPEMQDSSILKLDCVKFGKFNGAETIRHVDNIMRIYNAFCKIIPS